jgi:putative SOS response-associated peptidase YedK
MAPKLARIARDLARSKRGGDVFAMRTTEPGPDIALDHDRQIQILDRNCADTRPRHVGEAALLPLPARVYC